MNATIASPKWSRKVEINLPLNYIEKNVEVRFQLVSNDFVFQVLDHLEINHLRLLLEISKVSVIFIFPFWIYYDYVDVMKMTNLVSIIFR